MSAEDRIGDSRTIGRRLREIRQARRRSLRVVVGLAGISAAHLSRLETGERALDRRSLIVALAKALEISPSELAALPMPLPTNGSDAGIDAVRRTIQAVTMDVFDGNVVSVEELSARAHAVLNARQQCRLGEVAATLPGTDS